MKGYFSTTHLATSVSSSFVGYFLYVKMHAATVDIKALVVSLFICPVSRAVATSGLKFFGNSNGFGSGDSSSLFLRIVFGSAFNTYFVDVEGSVISSSDFLIFFCGGTSSLSS